MATTYTGAYKRYNGTDWDTIWFQTSAAQVGESSSRFFIKPTNTVNGKPFPQNGGITLAASDIEYGGATLTCVTQGDTLEEAIASLDAGVDAAKKAIPSGVLTTSNMGDSITKVGTVTSGAWNASKIADAYIASASKWNGKQDKLTFDTEPTQGSNLPVTSGGIYNFVINHTMDIWTDLNRFKQGATKAYVIDTVTSDSSYNKRFNVNKESSIRKIEVDASEKDKFAITDISADKHSIDDLHVGDAIYTREASVKDWFYAGLEVRENATVYKYVFYQIDSDAPLLTGYVQKGDLTDSYSPTTRNPITGIGVKAALDTLSVTGSDQSGKYVNFVSQSGGKVSVGLKDVESNFVPDSKEPANGVAISKALSQFVALSSSNSGVAVSFGGTVQKPTFSVLVTSGSVSNGETKLVSGGKVYNYVNARATKVFCQADAPTVGVVTGDIWIDI